MWDTTRLNFVGATSGGDTYTYAWQNGTLLPVTFGVGSGAAGTVTLGSNINISNLTFAATGSGNYTIAGDSAGAYSLALQAAGSTITTSVAATISAPMVDVTGGTSSLIKAGAATLTLTGVNTYSAGTTINAGTLALSGTGTLGAATGALALNNSGSVLDLGGTSQSVGNFTGTAGTVITNSGATASTLTVGTASTRHDRQLRGRAPERDCHRVSGQGRHGYDHPVRSEHLQRRHGRQRRHAGAGVRQFHRHGRADLQRHGHARPRQQCPDGRHPWPPAPAPRHSSAR